MDYVDVMIPQFSKISIVYTGILVAILLFPFIIKKDLGVLLKISSYGFYVAATLILFVYYVFIDSLTNTTFKCSYKENSKDSEIRNLLLFGPNPFKLAGFLTLGFFAHTIVIPVMKKNKNQDNNKRDLFIAFSMVCFTYLSVGIFGYIGFSGIKYQVEFLDVRKNIIFII